MAKGLTIKEALKKWGDENSADPTKAEEIALQFQWPPIEKMDNTLSTLKACRKLSLSTNMIERIVGLASLKQLKILSLSRNYIKSLTGIEVLADHLEELWISYNLIEKLKSIEFMKSLKVLYIGNNMIKDWTEFNRMSVPPSLEDIVFIGNPLVENLDDNTYKNEATKRLPALKTLDGEPIIREV